MWQIARVTTCPECSLAHEIGRNAYRAAWTLQRSRRHRQDNGLLRCPERVFSREASALENEVLIKSTCKDVTAPSIHRIVECAASDAHARRLTLYACWGCSELCLEPVRVEWTPDRNRTGVQVGRAHMQHRHDHDGGSRGDLLIARCGPDLGLLSHTDLLPAPLLPAPVAAAREIAPTRIDSAGQRRQRQLPHLNVILVDGLSPKKRSEIMPAVERTLVELNRSGYSVLSFPKYSQVGRDSFQNWVPMLTGRSHQCFDAPNAEDLKGQPFISARQGEVQAFYDRLGTVLDELGGGTVAAARAGCKVGAGDAGKAGRGYGYKTALIDSDCDDSRMAYLRRAGTHVLRKEFCALEAEVGYWRYDPDTQCVGGQTVSELSLAFLRTLWEDYDRRPNSFPLASFTMLFDFHSNKPDVTGKQLDGPLAATLREAHPLRGAQRRAHARDVVTLLLSDHGQRRGSTSVADPSPVTGTDRPTLALIIPDSVRQAVGASAWSKLASAASETIVSPYDIAPTLVHLAHLMAGDTVRDFSVHRTGNGGNMSSAAGGGAGPGSLGVSAQESATDLNACFDWPPSRHGTSAPGLPLFALHRSRTCSQAGVPTEWCIGEGALWVEMKRPRVSELADRVVRIGTEASHWLEPQHCDTWQRTGEPAATACATWAVSLDGFAVAKVRVQVQFRLVFAAVFVSQRKVVAEPCAGELEETAGVCDPLQSVGGWRGPLAIDRVTRYDDCPCRSGKAERALCICQSCRTFRAGKASSEANVTCPA